MASPPSSELAFQTDTSLNASSLPQDASADQGGVVVKNEASQSISSLLRLFEVLGCFEKHGEQYIFTDRPAPSGWESCMNATASVRRLKLNSAAKTDASRISPALRGEPLFPRLQSLYIEDFGEIASYLSLFLSPGMRTIELVATKPSAFAVAAAAPALRALLSDLVEWSPGLQSFMIRRVPGVPVSLFKHVSPLSNLRILELSSLVGVKSFEDFRPLAPLALESLTLQFSCSSYTQLSGAIIPIPAFLSSLEKLHIFGPLDAVADFLQSLGSGSLTSLDVEVDSEKLSTERDGCGLPSTNSVAGKKKKKSRSTAAESNEDAVISETHSDIGGLECVMLTISSRWRDTLCELVIVSSSDQTIDFVHMTGFRLLEKLYIAGCPVTNIPSALESPAVAWNRLNSLHLPPVTTIPFSLLHRFAISAPCLEELTVALDVNEALTTVAQPVLSHPLRSLSLNNPSPPTTMDRYGGCSNIHIEGLPQLIRVARFLNALFPSIQKLEASEKKNAWGMVWQLMLLCQGSSADDKCRRPNHVHDEFEVV
ncbi:hypothetical protein D9756_008525 [Leucocoprinus leucothites]|uniref:Uncharacterized protein n=1 Tax=Leucocoprinus leucothites TaxID=201217 RepID=A0A8H5D0U7_9AGAR|nr:hypothetical protein D9756_008525 [Leucoagaricus leucothites]